MTQGEDHSHDAGSVAAPEPRELDQPGLAEPDDGHASEIDRELGAGAPSPGVRALDDVGAAGDGSPSRTRDLLAAIATRAHDVPPLIERELAERSFVRWLLGSIVVAVAVVLGAMWWLDPISVTGRETKFSIVENGGVRQAKLDLLDRFADDPPDVLVLGSSRSMKLDPRDIADITGGTAFNAAVSGGTTRDMYLYGRYAEDLWKDDEQFPHLVIGTVNDVFRFAGSASFDPRLRGYLSKQEQDRSELEIVEELLQTTTIEAAYRAMRRVLPDEGIDALIHPVLPVGAKANIAVEGNQEGNKVKNFDARGMQKFPPVLNPDAPIETRVGVQMEQYIERTYDADPAYTGQDERGVEMLRRLLELANEHGDVPTLWITPYQPDAERMLPKEYAARDRVFRAALQQLADEGIDFHLADFADIEEFDGDPEDFYDGIHMEEANTRRVVEELDRRGWLLPDAGSP